MKKKTRSDLLKMRQSELDNLEQEHAKTLSKLTSSFQQRKLQILNKYQDLCGDHVWTVEPAHETLNVAYPAYEKCVICGKLKS